MCYCDDILGSESRGEGFILVCGFRGFGPSWLGKAVQSGSICADGSDWHGPIMVNQEEENTAGTSGWIPPSKAYLNDPLLRATTYFLKAPTTFKMLPLAEDRAPNTHESEGTHRFTPQTLTSGASGMNGWRQAGSVMWVSL